MKNKETHVEQKKLIKKAKNVVVKSDSHEPDASLADYDDADPRRDDMDAQFRVAVAKKNS